MRDLMIVIKDVYEANYSCYGVRKMWKAINRDYADRFGELRPVHHRAVDAPVGH